MHEEGSNERSGAAPTHLILCQVMPGRLDHEERLLETYAKAHGIPVTYGSVSMMERGRIPLDGDVLVAGSVLFVLHALRRLGVSAPEHAPYPEPLHPWLGRPVARYPRLRDALAVMEANGRPMFIKPAAGWKRFTGFVANFRDDPRFNGASSSMPVWTSEPIDIVCEWRAYVVGGVIESVQLVPGGEESAAPLDTALVAGAVAELVAAGLAPAGFAIDFGVTVTGQTVLIEVNDGFAIGAYGSLNAGTYWSMIVARWRELTMRVT